MSSGVSGRELLTALKATAGMPGPALVVPVGSPPEAFLRPVATREELLNPADIQLLTDWRNRFVKAFLTEFHATSSRTARWLVDVVGPKDGKILFMIDDTCGRTWGHMGLDQIDWKRSFGEADAIVRGGEASPGSTKRALQTLLAWGTGQLGLREMTLRVRSDNTAVEFYRKVGFREIRRVPLRRAEEPEITRWIEDSSLSTASVYVVHMRWEAGV
jgi:RimJ/RimL family protein N-acetyltransferase